MAVALLVWGWWESKRLGREPYDYAACRKKGFAQEFCTATPINGLPNPSCKCEDGTTGKYRIHQGATCICK